MTRKSYVPMGGVLSWSVCRRLCRHWAAPGRRLARLKAPVVTAAPAASNPVASLDAGSDDRRPGSGSPTRRFGRWCGRRVGRVMAGYIDRSGEWRFAAQFADARPFKEVGRVAMGDRWGSSTRKSALIPASFVQADDFFGGMALVRNDQQKTGSSIARARWSSTTRTTSPGRSGAGSPSSATDLPTKEVSPHPKKGIPPPESATNPCPNFARALPRLGVDNQIGFFDTTSCRRQAETRRCARLHQRNGRGGPQRQDGA